MSLTFGQRYAIEPHPDEPKLYTQRHNTALINFETGKVIRTYPQNELVTIVCSAIHKDKAYFLTADAMQRQAPEGFRAKDLAAGQAKASTPFSNVINKFRKG